MDMNRFLTLTFAALCVAASAGCQGGRMHVVQSGQTTWRSSELPVDRDGGGIKVHVDGPIGSKVTVILARPGSIERMHGSDDVVPIAAAEAVMRGEGIDVRFNGLPGGRYMVGSFLDLDGDGTLVHAGSVFGDGDYSEPHSTFSAVEVLSGSTRDVRLTIPKESS
jgi:hypothetical protein